MQLHFREFGAGTPLVILHGLFGSSDNWLGIAPRLADQFRVFILDLRNHGQSPHSDEMNYSVMAGDVVEFLDAQTLERASVLGHSMGGKVAMRLALDFPSRLEKLIVADMAPRLYAPEYEGYFAALLALDLKAYPSRRQIEEALAPAIPNLVIRRFLLKNLGHHPDGSYFWRINLDGIHQNYPALCAAIISDKQFEQPTLFLSGGKSNYVTETDRPQILKLFPRAKFEVITNAGHWLHADAPEEFVRCVSEYLSASDVG
ncbi:MAG: alpha/beta fold hydrolase [Limisphaerales bacterium]